MAAALVADALLQVLRQGLDLAQQVVDGQVGVLGALDQRIEVVDVGLVVLGIVDLHRGRIHVRFQRVVSVGQLGQGVGHEDSPWV